MKWKLIAIICSLTLFSCSDQSKWDIDVRSQEGSFELLNFEQDFYSKKLNLKTLRSKYPLFLIPNVPDSVYLKKQSDSIEISLYKDSQKNIDFEKLSLELTSIFKHIKHYYPTFKTPKVYTYISVIDYNYPILYKDGYLMIALDCFLGKDYINYQHIPAYLRHTYDQAYFGSKVIDALAPIFIKNNKRDFRLISDFINSGKGLLLKDALIPASPDSIKTLYQNKKLAFCVDNEFRIWNYFVDNDLLFKANNKLKDQFLKVAPFSKFYLDIDSETPGQIGKWIGWKIIQKYYDKNNVTLPELLAQEDAKELFKNSKYKPKK